MDKNIYECKTLFHEKCYGYLFSLAGEKYLRFNDSAIKMIYRAIDFYRTLFKSFIQTTTVPDSFI